MGLKARLASLDGVADDVTKFYVEKDGEFVLDVEPVNGFGLDDTRKLKNSLSAERSVTKKLHAFLEALVPFEIAEQDEKGNFTAIHADKIAALREAAEKAGKGGGGTADPDLENIKREFADKEKRFSEKFRADLEAKDKMIAQLNGQLEKEILESNAVSAINKSEGDVTLLLPHVMRWLKTERDSSGRLVPRVIREDGEGIRLTDKQGSDPMTIEEFVGSLKNRAPFNRAFAGSGASGGGSTGDNGAAGGHAGGRFVLSRQDAGDPVKYREARDKAMKAGKPLEMVE